MGRFLVRRLLESIPVIFGVSILAFSIIHLIPGDPATAMLGERASPESVEAIRERMGLNKPLYEQYIIWMGNIVQGDFGTTARGTVASVFWGAGVRPLSVGSQIFGPLSAG